MGRQRVLGWVLIAFGATSAVAATVSALSMYFRHRAIVAGPQAPKPVDLAKFVAETSPGIVPCVTLFAGAMGMILAGWLLTRRQVS